MVDTLKSKFIVEASANTTENISDTVGSSEVDTILSISICNTHASTDTTFKMWVDGTTPNTDAFIYLSQSLPAKSTFIHNSKIVLLVGDVLKFETTAAVSCQIVTSYLHQTAVATSSGSDYLDRVLIHDTSGSAHPMVVDGSTSLKTVVSFTVCNKDTSTAGTFDVYVRNSSGTAFRIYQSQTLPPTATFEHSDKIILGNNEELVFDSLGQASAFDVITSYLRQVP